MSVQIVPHNSDDTRQAIREFNRRMTEKGQTEFLLGENPRPPEGLVIREEPYLAVDETQAVRGGLLLAEFPSAFSTGVESTVVNCREPLSEGIIDSNFAFLGLMLIKFMQRRSPHLFALGMGGESMPFPRLLKSAGWHVSSVPFFFRVLNAGRFFRELQLLRKSPAKRLLSQIAALSGTGKLAISAAQFRSIGTSTRGLSLEPITSWGSWVDDVWQRCRGEYSFAVRRDLNTVSALYPIEDRLQAYLIRRDGQPVGWSSALVSPMQDHKYFGNLKVATILDAIAPADVMTGLISLTAKALRQEKADLIVTNQSHADWIAAFRKAGFLTAGSNFVLALSKKLTAEIESAPGGMARVHFTRGDSDGRIHL